MKRNNDLLNKLNDFMTSPNDHAFLLCGPWGVGKTHLVFEEWLPTITNYKKIPISLFGISSLSDLNSLVLSKESFANRFKNYLNKLNQNISVGVGPVSVGLPLIGIVASALTMEHNERDKFLFVIDDIERKDNKLSVAEILGFVDSLPKENTKVVLIANVDKMTNSNDKEYLKGFKEKVIQREYNLTEPTEEAIQATIGEYHDCLTSKEAIYPKNLRTLLRLKEIINNCGRLNETLVKTIYICLLSISEARMGKEDYLINFEKHELSYLYLLDSVTKEKVEKEVEIKLDKCKKQTDTDFNYLLENVRLLYLLDEINEDNLKVYLDQVYLLTKNEDYLKLKEIIVPLRNQPLAKCPINTSAVFYSSNSNAEYKKVMLEFEEIFKNKKYDLLDSFKKLIATILNYKNIISPNSLGKKVEKRIIKNCKKPLAEYIVFEKGPEPGGINDIFGGATVPTWVIDLEKEILKECSKSFNNHFVEKAKNEGINFDIDYFLDKATMLKDLFRDSSFDKDCFAIDGVFQIVAKDLIKICSKDLKEEVWQRCHHFFKKISEYKGLYSLAKTIDEIKNSKMKNVLAKHRVEMLIKYHSIDETDQ